MLFFNFKVISQRKAYLWYKTILNIGETALRIMPAIHRHFRRCQVVFQPLSPIFTEQISENFAILLDASSPADPLAAEGGKNDLNLPPGVFWRASPAVDSHR